MERTTIRKKAKIAKLSFSVSIKLSERLFFKALTSTSNFAPMSHCQDGIEIQTYCAIIACMLISLWTRRKPTLRTHEMICWYFCGMANDDELLNHINRLKKVA